MMFRYCYRNNYRKYGHKFKFSLNANSSEKPIWLIYLLPFIANLQVISERKVIVCCG